MKRNYARTQRVADLIQKAIAQMLVLEMADQRFKLVTITSVNVSDDLSYAKVYVTVLEESPAEIKQTISALNRANKRFRYQLARAVDLRVIPELKFVYDESTAQGFHISALIDSAMDQTEKTDKTKNK